MSARPYWNDRADGRNVCATNRAASRRYTDTGGASRTPAPRKRCPTELLAHIASLGREHIGLSGGYVWPSEPLKHKVSALRKLRSANSSPPLTGPI